MNRAYLKLLSSGLSNPDANLALSIAVVVAAVACAAVPCSYLAIKELSTERRAPSIPSRRTVPRKPNPALPPKEKCDKQPSFNALILPKSLDVAKIISGEPGASLPEPDPISTACLETLADMTVPVLERRLFWREENCDAIICGMGGRRSARNSSEELVDMGAALADALSFKPGDAFLFNGIPLKVASIRPEKGDLGDITIWMSLKSARSLLETRGEISGVFLFACSNLEKLSETACKIYPGSRIIEFHDAKSTSNIKPLNKPGGAEASTRPSAEERASDADGLEKELAFFCSFALLTLGGWFYALSHFRMERNRNETAFLLSLGAKRSMLLLTELLRSLVVLAVGIIAAFAIDLAATAVFASTYNVGFASALPRAFDPATTSWTCFIAFLLVVSATTANALRIFSINPIEACARASLLRRSTAER